MMWLLVIVLLTNVYGLQISTDAEGPGGLTTYDVQVRNLQAIPLHGGDKPLQALKHKNDVLDTYIFERLKMLPRNDPLIRWVSLSWNESDGFFNEPDDVWSRRKQRHINQMNMENLLRTTCSDELFDSEKACTVGCVGDQADCPANVFWQTHFEPSFSCIFEERLGVQGEGGKWVCDPYKIRESSDCLVYSVGSAGQYDFEKSVHKRISPSCDIYTIDMKPWTEYTRIPPPEYVTYHVATIGTEPNTPVDALVRQLGHTGREIDVFKIDCEGCEWETFKSWFGGGVVIRQVLVEIHGTGGPGKAQAFFDLLFDQGYVVFHKEPNIHAAKGSCVEYGFVRLSPQFSRA